MSAAREKTSGTSWMSSGEKGPVPGLDEGSIRVRAAEHGDADSDRRPSLPTERSRDSSVPLPEAPHMGQVVPIGGPRGVVRGNQTLRAGPVVGAGLHRLGRPVTEVGCQALTVGNVVADPSRPLPRAPLSSSRTGASRAHALSAQELPVRVHPDGAASGGTAASRRKPLTMSGRIRTVMFVDCPAQGGSRSA